MQHAAHTSRPTLASPEAACHARAYKTLLRHSKGHACFRQKSAAPRDVAHIVQRTRGIHVCAGESRANSGNSSYSTASTDGKASPTRSDVATRAATSESATVGRSSSGTSSDDYTASDNGSSNNTIGGNIPSHLPGNEGGDLSDISKQPASEAPSAGTSQTVDSSSNGSSSGNGSSASDSGAPSPAGPGSSRGGDAEPSTEPRPWLVGDAEEASTYGQSGLDARIMSGEFTDRGSTKARLTQPVRKALSKGALGPGTASTSIKGEASPFPVILLPDSIKLAFAVDLVSEITSS